MKNSNIVLFKRFLRGNGINQLFAGLYRQFHFPESPADVEDYLRAVDALDAVINAFKFPQDLKTFGPEFWLDVAVKWETTLKNAEKSGYYNQGWNDPNYHYRDLVKPLSSESHRKARAETIESVTPTVEKPVEPKKEKPKEAVDKLPPLPEARPAVSEEEAALSGFQFLDVSRTTGKLKLAIDEATIGLRSGFRLTFNKIVSDEIIASGFQKVRVAIYEGNMYAVFSNDKDGLEWRINSSNVVISKKELITQMMDILGIKSDFEKVNISKNLAPSEKGYLTYKIKRIEKKENNKVTFL